MSEKTTADPRAARREGDSAQARFYRRKDEVLGGKTVKDLEALGAFSGGPGSSLGAMFGQIRSLTDRLNQAPDDEEALQAGLQVFASMESELDRLAK